MRFRRINVMLLSLILFFTKTFASTFPTIPIDVSVNDTYIMTDTNPFILNDTTYLPMRSVGQALGVTSIKWDNNSSTATIINDKTEIKLINNSNFAYINNIPVNLNKNVLLSKNRVFMPLRFASENLGAKVECDSEYYIVNITKDSIEISPAISKYQSYNDLHQLAGIIEIEASGKPLEGKVSVGEIILNRVKNTDYPDTIFDSIIDDKFGIQFEPIKNYTINNTPSLESVIAAKLALRGKNHAGNNPFFLNPRSADNLWIAQNRKYNSFIVNHTFYL